MCLGIPGKILSIDEHKRAVVEISGVQREVRLDLIAEATEPGDYVICHAGFAIHRIDETLARELLDCLREIAGT
jgi:hydrogenase expression/formation protein HypC